MTDASTHDLVQRLEAFLEPGDIELAGVIVHTGYSSDQEIELYDLTLEVGDIVAAAEAVDDWYVYSGNDDSRFASNQHQGLRLDDDSFVWECQHLLRSGEFALVMYYEADIHRSVLEALDRAGFDATGVPTRDSEGLSGGIVDNST